MFSKLRPHHKRTSSNPSSPAIAGQSFESSPDHGHPQRQQDSRFLDQPTRAPPSLPPVSQVSPTDYGKIESRTNGFDHDTRILRDLGGSHVRPDDALHSGNRHKLQSGTDKRPDPAGNHAPTSSSGFQSSTSDNTSWKMSGNHARTDAPKSGQTGRRANGSRLPSPPPPKSNFAEPPPRSGKTRLNLLNPMSLLARRRTSQAIPQLSAESLVSRRSNFSDPRIHGTVVHDFSAPRAPRRGASYNDADNNGPNSSRQHLSVEQNADETLGSPWSGGNHTPVFTENFEEEQYPAAGPHVRKASDLTDLPPPQPPYAKGKPKSSELPPMARDDEARKQVDLKRMSAQQPISVIPPPLPPKSEAQTADPRRISIDTSSTPPKKGRSRNVSEVSLSNIPKHMKSTSSRFSFDMIGAAKQERLLEDRHRQKALEKKAENDENDEQEEDDFADFDYDMDDDGLEEPIPYTDIEEEYPGNNLEEPIPYTDIEEEYPDDSLDEGYPNGGLQDACNLGGFTFQQSSLGSPISSTSPNMTNTPRDSNGEVIGFALGRNSPFLSLENITSQASPELSVVERPTSISENQGLGLHNVNFQQSIHPALRTTPPENVQGSHSKPTLFEDDDLYFDDGMIGGLGDDEDHVEFDESVFDNLDTDQYGRPLQVFAAPLPTLYEPPNLAADVPSLDKITEHPIDEQIQADCDVDENPPNGGGLAPQPSVLNRSSTATASHGLTQDTLAAYQTALAAAAFAAVIDGKFVRESSPLDDTPEEEHQPGLVTDSSAASHYETFSPSYELEDDFDYDDALEDDAIIAAANAEALANDCDGFYGQEFGFYSAPAAAVGDAEYINGGYFGPRGIDGIGRNPSGRGAVLREPNLTPITERSEYSNRNSFMSFPMHSAGLPSPGLAQLAGMLRTPNDFEGDMSLEALMKLRRGAWGGSQVSLHSSTGSPRSPINGDDSSPVAQTAPWSPGALAPLASPATFHRRKNSAFSIASDAAGVRSEVSSEPPSPTLTFAALRAEEYLKSSPVEEGKYRHTTSAESISYLKEGDPVVGERWILERRRTAESGEIEVSGREVSGREVVSSGRI